jgi:hypothetical protein
MRALSSPESHGACERAAYGLLAPLARRALQRAVGEIRATLKTIRETAR